MADHVEQPNPLACNVCSETFNDVSDAKKHRACHQSYKFACPDCGYIFVYEGTYYDHYNIHIPHVKGRHSKKSTKKPKAPLPNKKENATIQTVVGRTFDDLVLSNTQKFLLEERWFLQLSYYVQPLLLRQSGQPALDFDISSTQLDKSPNMGSDSNWEIANGYYYKSVAMVQLLRQIRLNFHKDFSLEKVDRTGSFLDHLIVIQQEQRSVAYGFADNLNSMKKCTSSLRDLEMPLSCTDHESSRKCFLPLNQHAIHRYMWQQKQIFDSLYAVAHEASLLLRKIENTHMITCESVNGAANRIPVFIETFIPNIRKSKELLDLYLLGDNTCTPPFVVSKQMEQLVILNFRGMKDFEEHIQAFCKKDVGRKLVEDILLGHFGNILSKGKVMMKEFHSGLEPRDLSIDASGDGVFLEKFTESVKGTFSQIMEAFRVFDSLSNVHTLSEDSSSGNITLWKALSESCLGNLRLDLICEKLGRTSISAVELVHHAGYRNPSFQVQTDLKRLHVSIDLILMFGNVLLLEFLTMQRIVAEMTYRLANVFASLYSNGYCASPEEQVDNTSGDRAEDASGTGMGEGAGLNDVSDQINGEDQLLGCDKVSIYARAQDLARLKKIGAMDAILENTEIDLTPCDF